MKLIDDFGSMSFGDGVMQQMLGDEAYGELYEVRQGRAPLTAALADMVAAKMLEWAVGRGATHFCHWFMPLNGLTSEKHDAFIGRSDGKPILEFSGKNLLKGESDASSFPSGGLRAMFEARGYTAWDCTSPAYVWEGSLYIPTVFCSYNGEALDQKTPLLRSMRALDAAGTRFLRAMGDKSAGGVYPNVGAEQEYFLVDVNRYNARADLKLTGKTLIGKLPPKGQELADHYYGTLKKRVSDFMRDLDAELWRLGVYAKTRHNEAAPAQHELAPLYSPANIAADHNYLTMTVMKRIAQNHGLVCLLHEKPFSGVNGSGKHNNWSLSTDTGVNLLEPGKDVKNNLMFLLTLTAAVSAVDKHTGLLRMAVANAGNDCRLGAGEAPPAIISIYIGDELAGILEEIRSGNGKAARTKSLNLGVAALPEMAVDNSDRNRTSPLAFTGNKFEFRMVGAGAALGSANTVLNSIAAAELDEYAAALEKDNSKEAVYALIREKLNAHGRVLFNGNSYSDEWKQEAKRRGLPDLSGTAEAVEVLRDNAATEVLVRMGTYSQAEIDSRYQIMTDTYVQTVKIEAATLVDILRRQIAPAAVKHLGKLTEIYNSAVATKLILNLNAIRNDIGELTDNLSVLAREATALNALLVELKSKKSAAFVRDAILPAMAVARRAADNLERIIPKDKYPMPSYEDILYF
ncbi:MAG: glutamine synthetase III [Firmicutes bacterium]|nr:glutamine synthetase III [Bacillota bacterium]